MIGERSKAPYMKLFHNRFNFILTIFDNFQAAHIRWRNGICLHFNKPAILIGKIIGKFRICEHVFIYLKNFPANWRASDTKITNAFYRSYALSFFYISSYWFQLDLCEFTGYRCQNRSNAYSKFFGRTEGVGVIVIVLFAIVIVIVNILFQ